MDDDFDIKPPKMPSIKKQAQVQREIEERNAQVVEKLFSSSDTSDSVDSLFEDPPQPNPSVGTSGGFIGEDNDPAPAPQDLAEGDPNHPSTSTWATMEEPLPPAPSANFSKNESVDETDVDELIEETEKELNSENEKKSILPDPKEFDKLPNFDKKSRDKLGLDDYKPANTGYFDHLEKEANSTAEEDSAKYDAEQEAHVEHEVSDTPKNLEEENVDGGNLEKNTSEDNHTEETPLQEQTQTPQWTEHEDVAVNDSTDSTWSAPDPSEVPPEPEPEPEPEKVIEEQNKTELPEELTQEVDSEVDDETINEGDDFVVTHHSEKDEVEEQIKRTEDKISDLKQPITDELIKIDEMVAKCQQYISNGEKDMAKHSYNIVRDLFANSKNLSTEEQHQYHDILLGLYEQITQNS